MSQMQLAFTPAGYDAAKARELADGAMNNAADSAGDAFKQAVREAVEVLAKTGKPFNSDNIRVLVELQGYRPNDWRSIGGPIRSAVEALGLEDLGYIVTDHKDSHRRPKRHYCGAKQP
jgi:hypothetical protein